MKAVLHLIRQSYTQTRKQPPELPSSPVLRMMGHYPVHTVESKRKLCVHCQANKTKTKSGWLVYTTYKCNACDVPLCTVERACFDNYHQELKKYYLDRNFKREEQSNSSDGTSKLFWPNNICEVAETSSNS
ncbi:hypothetical protein KUTeg_023457 [Tegillarca granosa]|uniref:PiggyBac transposable element-derived protein 4 C-terminal zinc-finger domain-containing protein n=1 Tax=Tegillarca granosa TaxID=220873 RepID=A0ABQ9E776_TEGGR|nr:hypothetical protein KUTeg_023457 [Tegillarca granosa]